MIKDEAPSLLKRQQTMLDMLYGNMNDSHCILYICKAYAH
jgi:hypothetical protein